MEDVFSSSRDGNVRFVRTWLEDTANDLNQGDDHGFTPLHWASREGQIAVFDTLLTRGARVATVNHGGDTPLHLAASTNQKEIVRKLIKNKASVNAINEHGNTPLHYACFWNYEDVAQELIKRGALVTQENKYGEIPLDKCKAYLKEVLKELATQLGHDLKKVSYKDNSKHFKHAGELRDIKNRNSWIDPKEINVIDRIGSLRGNSELWKGIWNGIAVVVKKLHVPDMNHRKNRDFHEEFPRLKIFSHPNVLPVLGAVNQPPTLMILSQYMLYGSLYNVLHEGAGILVDQSQAIKFAVDVARGAEYLHSLEPLIPRLYLTSTHIMIDEDLTARISMGDYRFSFLNHKKMFLPNWMAPEVLQKSPEEVDQRSADMWSFAILLWELTSREVPFADLSPMEIGMKVALEGLRPQIPPGVSTHMVKLINIAWNADPNKRPRFNQIMTILSKM